ncbi:MAG: TolC family protein [Desulfuromonadales bacterium]
MKRKPSFIAGCLLLACALHMSVFAEPTVADSVIRITGDGGAKSQYDSSRLPAVESSPTPVRGSTTIKIIGDKADNFRSPSGDQTVRSAGEVKTATEKESLSQKTPEQEMAERLEVLRTEKERRDAEKLELERLEKLKAEQEKAAAETARIAALKQEQELLAARQAEEERKIEQEKTAAEAARIAAFQRDQEQLAARKAEEERKNLQRVEQERIEALKIDEDRLAAARRVLAAESPPVPEIPVQQTADSSPSADSPAASVRGREADVSQISEDEKTAGQTPATIWDLYLSARANDPALGRSNARVTGSLADSDQLFSTFMPHLDSSAGVQQISQTLAHYNTPNEVKYDYTSFNYSLIARMTLLNVPAIYSLSAAGAGLRVEQAGVAAARQNLIIKFTDSYFALLKAQADKHIALGEIKRLKQVLDQSRAFFKEGTGDLISVYEAQSRLDGAGADLTRSDSSLRLAEQKLSSVVGKPVKSIVNYLPQQPAKADPDDLDWWVTTMEKEQPLLRQAREGLIQSSEQKKSVKAEYLPVLQTSGGYTVSRGTADLPTAEVRQWFVGASLSLPWYSGGETAAKVRRAVASEEERQHAFDETIEQQRENVKQAFYNLRYNISLIKALEQKMTSAEIQLDAVKKGRNMGLRNAIDLLNAEQSYSLALRDYKYALYDNFIRVFQLKSAAGILADADVSEVSKKASPTLSSRLRYYTDINPN